MLRKFKNILAAVLAVLTITALLPATALAVRESGDYKLVAITFDDGPGAYTDKLLDALKARNAKATFFVVGNRVNSYPETVKRIINEGHQLASHTWNHSNLADLSYSGILGQFSKTANALNALGGDGDYWVRPPYGSVDSDVKAAAKAAGIPLIYWSVDSLDWQYLNTSKTVNRIMNTVGDGSIILLHDLYKTSVNAAIQVMDRLIAKGYEFVTVEELFARRGVSVQNGGVYYNAPNKGINLGPEIMDPEYYNEEKIKEHWGYEALKWSLENELFLYAAGGTYAPNKYMTRAMFVEALGKVYGADPAEYPTGEKKLFSDVPDNSSYGGYVRWAVEQGIIEGDGAGRFNPYNKITRQEIAACLERFMKNCLPEEFTGSLISSKKEDPEAPDTGAAGTEAPETSEPATPPAERELTEELYSDADRIADWALSSVLYCSETGVFVGGSEGKFLPCDNISRAQGATILLRVNDMLSAAEDFRAS